jgi:hypothetical protein
MTKRAGVSLFNIIFVLQIAKKGALDLQSQVIKFTSCVPMVGGSI